MIEARTGVGFLLSKEAGEFSSAGAEHVAIEEKQRLGGHSRFSAPTGDLGGLREIKNVAQLRRSRLCGRANHREIDGAFEILNGPELFQSERGWVHCFRAEARDILGILEWQGGTTVRWGKPAADGEHRVAHRFSIEPLTVHAPEQTVVGVLRCSDRIIRGAHAIGTTEHEAADELPLRPATMHEAHREMIEQLRMRWRFTTRAEVVDAAHQPLAKELLPDAIHCDAGSQRVARIGNPVGQLHTTTLARGDRRQFVPGGHTHHPALHLVAERIRIAANGDAHVRRLITIMHGECLGFHRSKELGVLCLALDGLDASGQGVALLLETGFVFLGGGFDH